MPRAESLLAIYRCDDPEDAFQRLLDAINAGQSLSAALWVGPAREVRRAWPPGSNVTSELIDTVYHIPNPELIPLGSEFPTDAVRYPNSEVLVLPLRPTDGHTEVCLFIAEQGILGEDLDAWEALAEALESCVRRGAARGRLEDRAAELQARVEESEALHTLGLAANRTLNPDEVLRLVARFSRTLLGADYVTVSTAESGQVRTIASVGLRNAEAGTADYLFGRRVVEAEKPLVIGPSPGDIPVESFPFHVTEGMRAGLGIPLSVFGETFGALVVGYRNDYKVSPRDIRFGLTLAGHAAVAIGNARLHERVEQRSRELELAYEDLRVATQAKERFFASINHELRNPIGAVLGYLTLALDAPADTLSEPERGFIEKALRGANTLKDLVNDLLDLSKIAAGKMEVNLRPCMLSEIIAGTMNTIEPLARASGVSVQVPATIGLPPLLTDSQRAQQILVNLLSNAVKFTGPEGVRLEFQRSAGEGETEWVEVSVIDTGPGISSEDLVKIFEEFEQVAGTKGGTGLGLPISRRLARLIGGDLSVRSAPGRGTAFILRLPQAMSPSASATESDGR